MEKLYVALATSEPRIEMEEGSARRQEVARPDARHGRAARRAGRRRPAGHRRRLMKLPGFDISTPSSPQRWGEDLGEGGDISPKAVIPAEARCTGRDGHAGGDRRRGPSDGKPSSARSIEVETELLAADGDRVPASTDLMRLRGKARALLTAERSALNTLQHSRGSPP
jgi:hypothetical protein